MQSMSPIRRCQQSLPNGPRHPRIFLAFMSSPPRRGGNRTSYQPAMQQKQTSEERLRNRDQQLRRLHTPPTHVSGAPPPPPLTLPRRIWRRYRTGGFEAIPGGRQPRKATSHLPVGTCQNRTALHRFDTLGCSPRTHLKSSGPAPSPDLRSASDGSPGAGRRQDGTGTKSARSLSSLIGLSPIKKFTFQLSLWPGTTGLPLLTLALTLTR